MSLDVNERENVAKTNRYLLGFRETVTLSIGFFPNTYTKSDLFKLYSRIHAQLTRINAIEFDLPKQSIFEAMLKKLQNKKIVQETYMTNNYGVSLTESGEAAFDVILANLQSNPSSDRILNVFDFYRNAPVNLN